MKELDFLQKMLPRLRNSAAVVVPPGDDCAAVRCAVNGELELLAADQLISDLHFFSGATAPERAGAKLLKRNLSDIAAMGGTPDYALCTVATDWEDDALLRFFNGLEACAEHYGVSVVGGDMAGLPAAQHGLFASLSITGHVPVSEVVTRAGAKAGETVFVTGTLGNSLASEHHLDFIPRLLEGRFLARGHWAGAMLDISDGLLLDAGRLSAASRVGIQIDGDALPLRAGATLEGALSDGEDYELLFTVASERADELLEQWPETFAPITRIGATQPGAPGVYNCSGQQWNAHKKGFIHGK